MKTTHIIVFYDIEGGHGRPDEKKGPKEMDLSDQIALENFDNNAFHKALDVLKDELDALRKTPDGKTAQALGDDAFESAFTAGASPTERIDLEINKLRTISAANEYATDQIQEARILRKAYLAGTTYQYSGDEPALYAQIEKDVTDYLTAYAKEGESKSILKYKDSILKAFLAGYLYNKDNNSNPKTSVAP